jgi:WD40 repeat protein
MEDGAVHLWDLTDRENPTSLGRAGGLGVAGRFALSPDGRTVLTSNYWRQISLWDASGGTSPVRIALLTGLATAPSSLAFSPDGRTIVAIIGDWLKLWDITVPSRPRLLSTVAGGGGYDLAFSPDGRMMTTGSTLWDTSNPAKPVRLGDFYGSAGILRGVTFSPDGHTMATTGYDPHLAEEGSLVTLWDYSELKRLLAEPTGIACAVADRGLTAEEWADHIPELPYESTCGV